MIHPALSSVLSGEAPCPDGLLRRRALETGAVLHRADTTTVRHRGISPADARQDKRSALPGVGTTWRPVHWTTGHLDGPTDAGPASSLPIMISGLG